MLGGCATRTGSEAEPSAPIVTQPEVQTQPAEPGEPEIIAYRPPATPEYTRPEPARAVKVLMERADDQRQAGKLVEAAGTLERALRIDPRNPVLWNQLAHVRLDQGQYDMAAGLAAKSNHFAAAADTELKQDNQSIIQRSRR